MTMPIQGEPVRHPIATRRSRAGVLVFGGADRAQLQLMLRGLGCDPVPAAWGTRAWPRRCRAAVVDLRAPAPAAEARDRALATLDAAGVPAVVLLDDRDDLPEAPAGVVRMAIVGGDPAAGLTVALQLIGAAEAAAGSGSGGLLGLAQDAGKQLAHRGGELERLLRHPLLHGGLEVARRERGGDRLEAPGGLGEALPVAHAWPPGRPAAMVPRMPLTKAAARSWQ